MPAVASIKERNPRRRAEENWRITRIEFQIEAAFEKNKDKCKCSEVWCDFKKDIALEDISGRSECYPCKH